MRGHNHQSEPPHRHLDARRQFVIKGRPVVALLVVGDYYFDRSELKNSEKYYKRILTSPESPSHGMARYKLAWVRINEEDMKGALKLFEDTIDGLNKLEEAQASNPGTPGAGKKGELVSLTDAGRAVVDPDGPLARAKTLINYCHL